MAELSIAGQEYRREGLIGHRPAGQEPGPKPELKKIRYTHDAVIDVIIATPSISQGELARQFGFSEGWLSVMVNCDAFQERLAERKAILVDPKLAASIEDRLGGLARAALDKLLDRMSNNLPISNGDLIAAAKLGVGDRNQRRPVASTGPNLYVVNIPPPSRDSQTWLNESSRGLPMVEQVNPLAGLMDPGGGA